MTEMMLLRRQSYDVDDGNQIKSNQDLYSAICSHRFRGAWRIELIT